MNYELRKTKNNDIIPVVDHIHLHSMYNPQKEAKQFLQKYKVDLKKSNYYLVLGLGFGYHIDELYQQNPNAQIIIIEPNTRLINDFQRLKGFRHQKISICSPVNAPEIFEEETFIDFLRQTPVILKHDLSFELNLDYFKSLLQYRSSNNLSNYGHLLNNFVDPEIKNVQDSSLKDHLLSIKTQTGVRTKSDFALLALESLT